MKNKDYAKVLSLCSIFLCACHDKESASTNSLGGEGLFEKRDILTRLSKEHFDLPTYFPLEKLKESIRRGNLKEASHIVNQALQISVNFPALHVINGIIYEERARRGDETCEELAGVAYSSACTLDPSKWLYAYLYGCYSLQKKQYQKAQDYLVNALILRPEKPEILYALACASYYVRDLHLACESIQKAVALEPKNALFHRACAIISAACSDFTQSEASFVAYKSAMKGNDADVVMVQERIADWKRLHTNTAFFENVQGEEGEFSDDQPQPLPSPDDQQRKHAQVITFDCYLLTSTQTTFTSMGQNILDSLRISMGGEKTTLPYVDLSRDRENKGGAITGGWTQNFAFSANSSNLAYSLNIANVDVDTVELLSRPTVTTLLGTPTHFLEGDQYTGATAGITGSTVASVSSGTNVKILPVSIDEDDVLTLNITLEDSTFLKEPDVIKGITTQLLSLGKVKLSTTVKARSGETIFIGGINSVAQHAHEYGTPLLKDLPVVQYFFASNSTNSDTRNTIFLISPRWESHKKKKKKSLYTLSSNAQKLRDHGVMSIGERHTVYTILRHLEENPLFHNFRSGDMIPPFWGSTGGSLEDKLEQIAKFLYF